MSNSAPQPANTLPIDTPKPMAVQGDDCQVDQLAEKIIVDYLADRIAYIAFGRKYEQLEPNKKGQMLMGTVKLARRIASDQKAAIQAQVDEAVRAAKAEAAKHISEELFKLDPMYGKPDDGEYFRINAEAAHVAVLRYMHQLTTQFNPTKEAEQ